MKKKLRNPNILMHRTVGLGIFCAKSNSRTKSANPDTLARKRSAAGDQGDKRTAARPAYRGGAQQGCSPALMGSACATPIRAVEQQFRLLWPAGAVQNRRNSAHRRVIPTPIAMFSDTRANFS